MRIREAFVDLLEAAQFVHRHLTSSMCEAVFRDVRTVERARKWTLETLAKFWVAVIMRGPRSLREALEEAYGGHGGFELIESSPSSFFERSQKLSWRFFHELFERFVAAVLADCPPRFEQELRARLPAFPEVWVVDGSGLDRVAKRLKAVRDVEEVVIPGSVLAFYDLYRGLPRAVLFYEQELGGEAKRLREAADVVPARTLVVGDRGFGSVRLFSILQSLHVEYLIRIRTDMVARDVVVLGRLQDEGCQVTDSIGALGEGRPETPSQRVRLIEKRLPDGTLLRIATSVLDPEALPASVALALYRRRWKVESLFQDLKQVLNLRRFYAANTNAVAMQLYASAIAYTALRTAQAHIAAKHQIPPEALSTKRLFPRVAAAHFRLVETVQGFEATRDANTSVELVEPDWRVLGICRTRLSTLLVQKRKGPRRRPGYSPRRKQRVSLQRYEQRRRPRGSDP